MPRAASRRMRTSRGLLALCWLLRMKDGWEWALSMISQAVKAGRRAEG